MPDQTSATLRPLPLRDQHLTHGARFGDFSGWEMPLWYGGAVEEHLAVRRSCGLFDISHMGRFSVAGADAGALLASLFTRDPSKFELGGSAYAFACNEQGGIVDDLIFYRRGGDAYLVICNAANADHVLAGVNVAAEGQGLTIVDLRETDTVLLAVQGPASIDEMAALLSDSVTAIPRRASGEVAVDGRSFFLARTGYTGEDGFEVMTSAADGAWLLHELLDAGCSPCGLAARDTLRLEAALPLHGHDIDETTTPYEAGLGWAVDLEHAFRGRDVLAQAKENTTRRLACIVAGGPGVMRAGCEIFSDDRQVGVLASGGHSPMLGKSIGMGYLPRALAREGASLTVELRGRRLAAHTVKRPFYTPGAAPA